MYSRSETTIDTDSIHNAIKDGKYKYVYLLTIAKHQVKDFVDADMLDNIHAELKWRLTDLYMPAYAYEVSPHYRQLHLHGIALTKRAVFYKENNSLDGFRLQWKKVYNLPRALEYVYKNAHNAHVQEQILVSNYYEHHYGF